MKNVFILFLLAIFSSSCEGFFEATKEIDLGEFAEQVTVVGRLINTELDSVEDFSTVINLGVLVSRSKSVLDTTKFNLIEDADVRLTGSDGLDLEYIYDDTSGYYYPWDRTSPFELLSVKENTTYELTIDVLGEGMITSTCQTKSFGRVEDVSVIQDDIQGDGDNILDRLTIEIDDPPGENYYLIKTFYPSDIVQDGDSINWNMQGYLYNYNSIFDENPNIFSDELFDGKKESLEFWSERRTTYWQRETRTLKDLGPPKRIVVFVWALSKEEYEFRKSVRRSQDAEGNPFAEPSIVFSNIENGIGVFSMSRIERFVIPWQQ